MDMITITRNFKSFQFSTWSIVLWVCGTVAGAMVFYFLTEKYLGFWIQGGITYAVVGILQMMGVSIGVELCQGSVWRFTGCRYAATMAYGCTGFEIVAVCIALLLFHPHPQNAADRQGIWLRKIKAVLASVGIMQGVNTLRLLIEMSQLYNWAHFHTFVAIAEAFITLPVLMRTRRWLPELVLPTIIDHKLDDLEVFQNLGIRSIEQFVREDPSELAVLLGISAGIVNKWMLRVKCAIESPEISDNYIDLYDICLWYSRAKTRNTQYLIFSGDRDSDRLFEIKQGALTEISAHTPIWENGLPVPEVKDLDAMQDFVA